MSWLEIFRRAKELFEALREKFPQKRCSNPDCPLGLNKVPVAAKKPKPTSEELIQHHKDMYKRNHPDK